MRWIEIWLRERCTIHTSRYCTKRKHWKCEIKCFSVSATFTIGWSKIGEGRKEEKRQTGKIIMSRIHVSVGCFLDGLFQELNPSTFTLFTSIIQSMALLTWSDLNGQVLLWTYPADAIHRKKINEQCDS